MSTGGAGQSTQHAEAQTVVDQVTEFFNRVAASGVQPRLRTVSGACRFDMVGAGTWRVATHDGVPTVTHDDNDKAPADCIVTCDAMDFVRIVRQEGHMNMFAALLQGLMTVDGDLAFAMAVLGSFTFGAVGSGSR